MEHLQETLDEIRIGVKELLRCLKEKEKPKKEIVIPPYPTSLRMEIGTKAISWEYGEPAQQ